MTDTKSGQDLLSSALRDSWELFSKNVLLFILCGLLHGVVTVLTLGVLGAPLTLGFIELINRCRRGESASPGDLFVGLSRFVPALIAAVMLFVLIGLGLFLLVIPGLVLAVGWMFTFQVMEAEGSGPWESMSKSFRLFQDNVPVTVGAAVILVLLNSFGSAFVLGTVVTGPFSLICLTFVYEKLACVPALAAPLQPLAPTE